MNAGRKTTGTVVADRPFRSAVLLYHRIAPPRASDHGGLTVSPQSFASQMRWLAARGFSPTSSFSWLQSLRQGSTSPRNILITFDDAYSDIADFALPVLQQHGFTALIFVVTGLVGSTNKWEDPASSSRYTLMTAEQIRYWTGQGFEFASHSRTHRDLSSLNDADIDEEISGSRRDLQQLLECPVTSFAYPYGRFDDAVLEAVRKEYAFAFTVNDGLNVPGTDPHLLRRTMVLPNDSLFEFALRVRYGRNPLIGARTLLSPIKKLFASGAR